MRVNANGEAADVTITLSGPDGSILGQPYTRRMVGVEQLREDLALMFATLRRARAAGSK